MSLISAAMQPILLGAAAMVLSACVTQNITVSDGPPITFIAAVQREWHTDVCIFRRDFDATTELLLAYGLETASVMCLGFGDREYVVAQDHSLFTMISVMVPNRAALLLTALRDTPEAAFGSDNVVELAISRAGLEGLRAYLQGSERIGMDGKPLRLGAGPYLGSEYFAASARYDVFYTCNTWTTDALRAAGMPVSGGVIFASDLMRQARRIAITQNTGGPGRENPTGNSVKVAGD